MPFVPDEQRQPARSAGRFVPDSAPKESAPKTSSIMRQLGLDVKRAVGRGARMGAEVVGALPLMAADFGVAVRDVGGNIMAGRPTFQKNREYPSEMYQKGLDQLGLPRPEGMAETITDVVGQAAFGSRLPVPRVANPAPANFVPQSQQALQAANRAGYVVPPATARPNSWTAGAAEGAAGKLSTGQRAAAMNQGVSNRLANEAVGLSDTATLSPAVLDTIRSEAGKAHEAIRGFSGEIVSDTQYRTALASAVRSFDSTAKQIPALAQNEVLAIAKGLEQPRFSPAVAVDAISLLRDKASTAYRAGDKTLGGAYRGLSNSLEDLVERRLAQGGAPELVDNFRAARELIAKTYSIQGALKGENIDASALARALDKGKFLSGTLRQIGQFAQRFPKAARVAPSTESLPPYSPLDMLAIGSSVAGGLVSDHPAAYLPAIYAAGRPAMRNFLLSPAGQSLMVNGLPNLAPRAAGAAIPVANALSERDRRTGSR